jgi:hypothetical protein
MLLNDGCAGVAVLNPTRSMEVQFDEHKLLIVYAPDLKPFLRILESEGVMRDDAMQLITEGEHLHSSDPNYQEEFDQLGIRLGVGAEAEHVSW